MSSSTNFLEWRASFLFVCRPKQKKTAVKHQINDFKRRFIDSLQTTWQQNKKYLIAFFFLDFHVQFWAWINVLEII